MPSCLAFMYEGCEPVELCGTVDALRRCGAEVQIYAHTKLVKCAHGITVQADITELPSKLADCLILPGGMGWKNLQRDASAKALTEQYVAANKFVAAICAAPSIALGHWGLIKGIEATCYPGMEGLGLTSCAKHVDKRVVVDGKFITAQGPGVSLEFGLEIATQLGLDSNGVRKGMLVK